MGVAVLALIAVMVAICCHRWIKPFWLAVIISGPLAAVLFQVAVRVQLGYVDPFALIALLTTTPIAWVISALVGLAIRISKGSWAGARAANRPSRSVDTEE
jgi:hypothetical protein